MTFALGTHDLTPVGWPPGEVAGVAEAAVALSETDLVEATEALKIANRATWYLEVDVAAPPGGVVLMAAGDEFHAAVSWRAGGVCLTSVISQVSGELEQLHPEPQVLGTFESVTASVADTNGTVVADVSFGALLSAGWAERRCLLIAERGGGWGVVSAEDQSITSADVLDVFIAMSAGSSVSAAICGTAAAALSEFADTA